MPLYSLGMKKERRGDTRAKPQGGTQALGVVRAPGGLRPGHPGSVQGAGQLRPGTRGPKTRVTRGCAGPVREVARAPRAARPGTRSGLGRRLEVAWAPEAAVPGTRGSTGRAPGAGWGRCPSSGRAPDAKESRHPGCPGSSDSSRSSRSFPSFPSPLSLVPPSLPLHGLRLDT